MPNYILSIIVPSYNTEKYIDECLPTFVDKRLFGKVKILLIDDGATDNTAEKIKPYINKYPQLFFFYHKENGGHGSVINYGVYNIVDTKYFKVIDGDDWVNTEGLVQLVDFLEKSDDDMIVNDYICKYPNENNYIKCCKNNGKEVMLADLILTIHSLTFKTSIFIDNHILVRENVFYEDNEYRLYPLKYVKKFSYLPFCVYLYRLGNPNQSVSFSSMIKHETDLDLVRKDIISEFLKLTKQNDNIRFHYSDVLSALYRSSFIIPLVNINQKKKERRNKMLLVNNEMKKNKYLRKTALKKYKLCRLLCVTNFRFLNIIYRLFIKRS